MAQTLKPINTRSKYMGLWYQPEWHCYTSTVFTLGQLRSYKGKIRFKVMKNRYYEAGTNRPNYLFAIIPADNAPQDAVPLEMEVEE